MVRGIEVIDRINGLFWHGVVEVGDLVADQAGRDVMADGVDDVIEEAQVAQGRLRTEFLPPQAFVAQRGHNAEGIAQNEQHVHGNRVGQAQRADLQRCQAEGDARGNGNQREQILVHFLEGGGFANPRGGLGAVSSAPAPSLASPAITEITDATPRHRSARGIPEPRMARMDTNHAPPRSMGTAKPFVIIRAIRGIKGQTFWRVGGGGVVRREQTDDATGCRLFTRHALSWILTHREIPRYCRPPYRQSPAHSC